MAGLGPAIHAFACGTKVVDARAKPGHDERVCGSCRSGTLMLGPVLEVLIGGLLTGVLYSLVALGVVLIFKASGVFNFAQGAMVLFAALSLVWFLTVMPLWLA